jgi:hypothetical protein
LTDSFAGIGLRCNIEKPLIRLRVLHNSFGLSVYGEDDGPFGLAKLPHHPDRIIAKGCERLNILRNIHGAAPSGGSLTYLLKSSTGGACRIRVKPRPSSTTTQAADSKARAAARSLAENYPQLTTIEIGKEIRLESTRNERARETAFAPEHPIKTMIWI